MTFAGLMMYNSPRHSTSCWKSQVVRLGLVYPGSNGVQENEVDTRMPVGGWVQHVLPSRCLVALANKPAPLLVPSDFHVIQLVPATTARNAA